MLVPEVIRFELPSRKIYRFQIVSNIYHAPDRPGVYGVFSQRRPTDLQDTPLLWGLTHTSLLELAAGYVGAGAKDPRVKQALAMRETFLGVILVDGEGSRERLLEELTVVPTMYDLLDQGKERAEADGPPVWSRGLEPARARMFPERRTARG
jgi:hypothetical protein